MSQRIIPPKLRTELRKMTRLAVPIALAQLGYVAMGTVDTLMVGKLGASAIGGVGIGSSIFSMMMVIGLGLLLSLDTLISHSEGAGQERRVRELLFQGLWLATLEAIPLTLSLALLSRSLGLLGVTAEIRSVAGPYLLILLFGLPPTLIQIALQRYWQARQRAAVVTWTLILANGLNVLGNLAFISGRWGFPAMGARGSAVSTLICRTFMAGFLWLYTEWKVGIFRPSRRAGIRVLPDFRILKEMLSLGVPAAGQIALEVGVFSLVAVLAAHIGTAAAAAHQIVISVASLTFMVPLGIGSAASVRVGYRMGGADADGARRAGWLAIVLSAGIMTLSSVMMLLFPRVLLGSFTREFIVMELGLKVLFLAALFQVFDGIQVSATGALRGLGETRIPMIANLLGHYAIGLPLGLFLAFRMNWGLPGLWTGLATGLLVVAAWLTWLWRLRTRDLCEPFQI